MNEFHGLKFGKLTLRKAGDIGYGFRYARPTREFSEAWKANKTAIKNMGYRFVKLNGNWVVERQEFIGHEPAHYTLEEVEANKAQELEFVKNHILGEIDGYSEHAYDNDVQDAEDIINNSTDLEFFGLDRIMDGVPAMIGEAIEAWSMKE